MPWSSVEIVSPHDPEARFSHKPGKVEWVGYKDHQTETCDEAQPNLIVHVVTTPAPEQDIGVVGGIHAELAERQLAPAEHLVDSGYVTPETAHHALIDHGIAVVGRSSGPLVPWNVPASPRRISTSIGKPRLPDVHKG